MEKVAKKVVDKVGAAVEGVGASWKKGSGAYGKVLKQDDEQE